ncbi:type II toxin-antitoxin system RelE/ParE family toxin [Roseicella aquatilis]|uniref:Type II toxin-antitoxin system RelE/ParE family toxin n=1 Tax=Roseicella aquatilis TaxID=2527868 RepID=A0A4R4DJT9_9PROT|nr:type II toxin-antitoxin system RelE/ParE family toxin [Roseicella aquatilis]TCZ59813.1 type II toxin-antitoxin system RelE/ParE family toxin [Roseicella aquatilis]
MIVWTLGAQEDARRIALEVHHQSPSAGRKVVEDFALAAERLSDFPQMGMRADEEGHRTLLILRGRYRVNYRLSGDCLFILGLSRGGQP